MASEWYVQQGGKQYGPMSAAQLKKLAAERKITPATQVRQGATGAWVQAARVQGLFGAAPAKPESKPAAPSKPAAAAPKPTAVRALPKADPLAPPAIPPSTPATGGLAPPPWARAAQPAAPAPATGAATIAKVLGTVAIIFGVAALATFWLAIQSTMLGWIGIALGTLGLLIGMFGLVVAALSKGAGLILNVAGTSGSAIGLVLAVVVGVSFGLFTSPPPQIIVERPALPPALPPQETPPPPKEPEPEPPPEPTWTDAGEPIEQPPIVARITGAGVEQVRLENMDLSRMTRPKPTPMLKLTVTIENTSTDKIVEVPGWIGGSDLVGPGVAQFLGGEAGKAVQAATATAKLTDNAGNPYKQTPGHLVTGANISFGTDYALRPGQTRQFELVFPTPLETIEYLRLELSAAGFGGTDSLRFQIPRATITGMPAPAGG